MSDIKTFSPPRPPAVNAGLSIKYDVAVAEFGDGYQERVSNGLHSRREQLNLSWPYLEKDNFNEIIKFFDDLSGITPFHYLSPTTGALKTYVCVNLNIIMHALSRYSVAITIDEVVV